jgi:hypothetical protein
MARHFTVTLTSGTNVGPYDIYYDQINANYFAKLRGTNDNADGLTLAQVQNGVSVTVPDEATTLLLYNTNTTFGSNCTSTVTYNIPGQPTPTSTPIPPTPTSTPTSTPIPPTSTPTSTPVPPTSTPTSTPIPSTPTSTPTSTPIPPTATPTSTPIPPTSTPTSTPIPPTSTPTSTPTPTPQEFYTIDFYFSNTATAADQPVNSSTIYYDHESELVVRVGGLYSSYWDNFYSIDHNNITGGDSETHTHAFRPGDEVTIYIYGSVTQGTKEYGNYYVDTYSDNDPSAYNDWSDETIVSGYPFDRHTTFTMPSENLYCYIDMGNSH